MSDLEVIKAAFATAYAFAAGQQQWALAHPGYGLPLDLTRDHAARVVLGGLVMAGTGVSALDEGGATITDEAGDFLA